MNFLIAAETDCGLRKKTNQDSLCVMRIHSSLGPVAFAVLCDGMGGLEKGELASSSVVKAFRKWAVETLPQLCTSQLDEKTIQEQWLQIAREQNQHIKHFADQLNIRIGTTAVVLLLTQVKYYILNVGDSRAYEIGNALRQITQDQSLVAREVAAGRLTAAEAEKDSRRNILLQCIGGADQVIPDFYFGDICKDAAYMLCSDGFRHEISPEEFFTALYPQDLQHEDSMGALLLELIEVNKIRKERDNISALLIRTNTTLKQAEPINKANEETRSTLFSDIAALLRKLFHQSEKPMHTEPEQCTASFQIEKEIIYIHTDDEIG